tara:strand:- start:410 stop:1630 length:1221 start_codon:yes stop_codon:yes gene_type:complete
MFKQVCKSDGYVNNIDTSHVLMDGGVLSVPFDRLNNFYKICVQSIKKGEHIFVVEQKTEVYNYFVDIDYNDDEPLEIDQVLAICKVISSKITTLIESHTMIISVSKSKPKGDLIKTGIHVNFPDLPVCQEQAIQLMYHIVDTLESVYPAKDWKKFIDQSVYGDLATGAKGSGFRMPWSYKKSKHEYCNGKGCVACEQTGKITEGYYLPVIKFLPDGSQKTLQSEPSIELMRQVTIRTDKSPDECIKVPEFCPIVFKKTPSKREGDFSDAHVKDEVQDSEILAHVETFIRKYLTGQESSRVLKIFKYKKTFLVKTNSRYCENINRNHSSNHVWFLIKDGIICQKCFCRCETMKDRKKFCKDFIGREYKLTRKVHEIIFGKSKNNVYSNIILHNSVVDAYCNMVINEI